MRVRIRLLISVLVLSIGSVASASNLVQNGGFESGNFSGWSGVATANNVLDSSSINPYEGSWVAVLANSEARILTQTLSTTVNGSETITFALADVYGGSNDSFEVYFGGNLLATISNTTHSTYFTYSYTVTATSTSTDLSFVMANPPGAWLLDAVSVTETAPVAVPEPSTLALVCVACVSGMGYAVFRRRTSKLAA